MEIHVSNFVFILLMIQYTVNLNNICVLIVSLFLGEFVVGQHIFLYFEILLYIGMLCLMLLEGLLGCDIFFHVFCV
jgi:hypothetical protein